jgi:hypothetical protein
VTIRDPISPYVEMAIWEDNKEFHNVIIYILPSRSMSEYRSSKIGRRVQENRHNGLARCVKKEGLVEWPFAIGMATTAVVHDGSAHPRKKAGRNGRQLVPLSSASAS